MSENTRTHRVLVAATGVETHIEAFSYAVWFWVSFVVWAACLANGVFYCVYIAYAALFDAESIYSKYYLVAGVCEIVYVTTILVATYGSAGKVKHIALASLAMRYDDEEEKKKRSLSARPRRRSRSPRRLVAH